MNELVSKETMLDDVLKATTHEELTNLCYVAEKRYRDDLSFLRKLKAASVTRHKELRVQRKRERVSAHQKFPEESGTPSSGSCMVPGPLERDQLTRMMASSTKRGRHVPRAQFADYIANKGYRHSPGRNTEIIGYIEENEDPWVVEMDNRRYLVAMTYAGYGMLDVWVYESGN